MIVPSTLNAILQLRGRHDLKVITKWKGRTPRYWLINTKFDTLLVSARSLTDLMNSPEWRAA